MARIFKFVFLLCPLLFLGQVTYAANFLDSPSVKVSKWVTKNDVTVYYVSRHSLPMVDIALLVKAGSVYDGKKQGIAYLTNAILNEGAGDLDANQIADQFALAGAQYSAYSNRDISVFRVRSLSDKAHLAPTLKIFSMVLTAPTFPKSAISLVKKEMSLALQMQQQNPATVAQNTLYKTIYGAFPYANNPLGTMQSRESISRSDLLSFYKNFYTQNRSIVVVVGDVTKEQVDKIVSKITSGLSKTKNTTFFQEAKGNGPKSVHIPFPSLQTTITLGQVGISRRDKSFFPLMLGNAILGGLPLSSQLFVHIREKGGLAYYASSGFNYLMYQGPFVISMQTRTENTQKALKLLKDIVSNFIKYGPSQEELISAKKNLIGRFPLEIATNSGILSFIISTGYAVDPQTFINSYVDRVTAVKVGEVKKAFHDKISLKKMVTVTVGPKKD